MWRLILGAVLWIGGAGCVWDGLMVLVVGLVKVVLEEGGIVGLFGDVITRSERKIQGQTESETERKNFEKKCKRETHFNSPPDRTLSSNSLPGPNTYPYTTKHT